MYTVLVTDDEQVECRGIITLLSKIGYPTQYLQAGNGRQALQILAENKVDILVTDICMPILDGIGLIQQASLLYPDLQIVVNSAYADFEYARKSLQYGATNYILKPVQKEEFKQVFDSVIATCEQLRKTRSERERLRLELVDYREQHILRNLLRGEFPKDDMEIMESWEARLMTGRQAVVALVVARGPFFANHMKLYLSEAARKLRGQIANADISEYENVLFLFVPALPAEHSLRERFEALTESMRKQTGEELVILVGQPVNNATEFAAVYRELSDAQDYTFLIEKSEVIFVLDGQLRGKRVSMLDDAIRESVFEDIQYEDFDKAAKDLTNLLQGLAKQEALSRLYVHNLFFSIIQRMHNKKPEYLEHSLSETVQKVAACNGKTQLIDFSNQLMQYAHNAAKLRRQRLSGEGGASLAIEKTLELIHREYGDPDLGLSSLACKVYFSPNYLSSVFKKETGQGVVQYIRQYRMERAAQMLLGTSQKIVDIARLCGFGNDSYFTTVFRAEYGLSPKQYRENPATANRLIKEED